MYNLVSAFGSKDINYKKKKFLVNFLKTLVKVLSQILFQS